MLDKEILLNQQIGRRTFLVGIGKLSLLSILAGRMFYMQLIKQDEYKTLSDKNRINLILLPPLRGQIYDIEGTLMATNKSNFRLLLDKNNGQNFQEELKFLAKILELTSEQYSFLLNKIKKASKRIPVIVMEQLTWQQMTIVEENKLKIRSYFIEMGEMRFYPHGYFISHLVGYTGQISEQELKEREINNKSFNVGKAGLEKYYEKTLKGEFGFKQMEVNAFGKYIRELSKIESTPGNDLYLNIDVTIQTKITPYLNKYGCSAIVMDVTNGNVIILASTPGFEPNNFSKLSPEYWEELINDPYKPLINKTIQNNYPPGSPFKIITILAALEAGIETNKTVTCIGGASALGGNAFRCHSKQGHGKLDMFGSIKYSCNAYMYEIARLIGPEKIINMARKFGFGELTGIDLPGEVGGFVPSLKWKKNKFNINWSLGDTLNLSIGQGFLLASPLQLARFSATIASNGKLFTPHIAKTKEEYKLIEIKTEYLEIIREAMNQAVNTSGGSAYSSRLLDPNFKIAGKTGTSQVQAKANANDDLSRDSIAWERRNHAIFLGFGPYHNPRYSIAVFVDHGGGGGRAAAPIASKIMKEILEKYC